MLGVFTIFLYTGVEVVAGNTIISYGVFLNIPIATAKFFSSFTIFAMLIGYVIGIIAIPKYLEQKNMELDALASRVILPYVLIMVSLLLLAVFLYYSNLPDIDADEENAMVDEGGSDKTNIFQFPHLLLGVFTIFLYTGVEVIAGNTIISYGVFLNIPIATAKFFSSFTIFAMLIGYVIGITTIPKYLKQKNALIFSSILGLIFTLMALITQGFVSVMFIALLGLANSLMWPSIWPLAITELGRFTKIGSSMMVMAISGAAVLPLLYGRIADISSPKIAYLIVIPIYLFVLFYAIKGHKLRIK